jgi:hypothetical protein
MDCEWGNRSKDKSENMTKFNLRQLHKFCTLPIEEVFAMTGAQVTTIPGFGRYGFIDNGGDVLAVAHLDVAPRIEKLQGVFSASGSTVRSVALDDRLGAYLICDFLPRLGLKYDILLTEGEEVAMSTAEHFQPAKQYNWMFQFDRSGTDVVMYEYENAAMRELLTGSGFEVGRGAFTDLCWLSHLGIKGFNFGTGYYNAHDPSCFADLRHTAKVIKLFKSFYRANVGILWEHEAADPEADEYLPDYYGEYGKDGLWQDDEAYTDDPHFWAVSERIWQEYGLFLEDLTWSDYCDLTGINPQAANAWIGLDFDVYRYLAPADESDDVPF